MLEQLGPDLWVAEGGIVSFFGFDYPTRMVVVRLDDGGLWLWSPIEPSRETEAEARALGPVRHLVSPNKLHHLFLAAWSERSPEAKLWGTASTVARFPELGFSGTLTDDPPPDWAGQIDQYHFTNSPFLDEVTFFHRKSRTAIIADLSQPFSQAFLKRHWPWWLRSLARFAKMVEGWGYPPLELRLTFSFGWSPLFLRISACPSPRRRWSRSTRPATSSAAPGAAWRGFGSAGPWPGSP